MRLLSLYTQQELTSRKLENLVKRAFNFDFYGQGWLFALRSLYYFMSNLLKSHVSQNIVEFFTWSAGQVNTFFVVNCNQNIISS